MRLWLLALWLTTGCATSSEVVITAARLDNEGHGVAQIGERRFTTESGFDTFLRGHRVESAILRANPSVPYRCIGWIIFALQRADVAVTLIGAAGEQ